MSAAPTHADAELILNLYEARREAEIRKARQWWTTTFWPQSADDVIAVMRGMGTQENAWFRQVLGYWGLATSFVTNGILSEKLFLEPSFSGELFVIYAKIAPFLQDLRAKTQNPNLLVNLETVVLSEAAKARMDQTKKNVENMRKARLEAKAS